MASNSDKWRWLCGTNTSALENFTWTASENITNVCYLDGISSVLQLTFILVFSCTILVLKCCTKYKYVHMPFLIRYPGHSVRWLVSALHLVVLLASVGEGALSSNTSGSSVPHLYIAPILGILCIILALAKSQFMEIWQQPHLAWLLLVYWLSSVVVETGHLLNLVAKDEVGVNIVRFDVVVLRLVFFCVLALVEMNVIRIRIFRCCYNHKSDIFPKDLKSSSMRYYHKYSSAFSSWFFHWVQPVLKTGAGRPLEIKDLGTLPYKQSARGSYEALKTTFLEEKERSFYRGKKLNLWKVCWKVSGPKLLVNIVANITHNVLGYVAILVIAGVTDYVYTLETIKVEALVYEKSLRLSMFLTTSGELTMGQISNHTDTDSNSVFWMVYVYHFILTTPFNIFSDQRLKQSNEVLQGIKLLKLYGLEELYELAIEAVRYKELKCLSRLLACMAATIGLTAAAPVVMTLMAFTIYPYVSGQPLEPGIAFASLALFNNLSVPLFMLPTTVTTTVNNLVSFRRLGVFFMASEVYEDEDTKNWHEPENDEEENVHKGDKSCLYGDGYTLLFTEKPHKDASSEASLLTTNVHDDYAYGAIDAGVLTSSLSQNGVPLKRSSSPLPESIAIKVSDGAFTWDEDSLHPIISDINVEIPVGKLTMIVGPVGSGKSSLLSAIIEEMVPINGHVQFTMIVGPVGSGKSSLLSAIIGEMVPINGHVQFTMIVGPVGSGKSSLLSAIIGEMVPINGHVQFTMIVGPVGSGKSSLLSAIIGEMVPINGHVQFSSERKYSVAYAAQKAWLCNASFRDNILFGQPVDEQRYKQVISACALGPDIEILPAGDMTEIGEKGINLSGGQKQRVSVARAMYVNRDIVILDDPLSALDVHVGSHLFQEGIVEMLLKQNKTAVLVTHQLQYLESSDKVIDLKDGRITAQGTFDEVTQIDPELYYGWRHALQKQTESESSSEVSDQEVAPMSETERDDLRKRVRKRSIQRKLSEKETDPTESKGGKLIEKEDMERGSVSYRVYFFYLKSIGYPVFFVLLYMISQIVFETWGGFWLADWSEAGLDNSTGYNKTQSDTYYIKGYAVIKCGQIVSSVLGLALLAYSTYTGSKKMYFGMLRNIIRAPLRFFDTTPVGRILNRMSGDQELIDMKMYNCIFLLLNGISVCSSAFIVNAIITPWFIVPVIPIIIVYYYLQSYYLKSTRELKRLDSVSKSPVFAFFSETLTGLETIRAYRTFMEYLDNNLVAFLYQRIIFCWLGVRLDILGSVVLLVAGGAALIGASISSVSSSLVGLGFTFALNVCGSLTLLLNSASNMEMMMNAVERVKHYTTIKNEEYEGRMPAWAWPRYGQIRFENIFARYAKELDPVLKGFSVNIKPGEKVGICGRTGSGKSSLTLSLFRVIDMFEGRITIDDVDIAIVPLTALRQRLSIIPQDPVLFTGSIRKISRKINTKQ